MKFDLPVHHKTSAHWTDGGNFSDHRENFNVTITSSGIFADIENSISSQGADQVGADDTALYINVSNQVESVHMFYGLGFVLGGIALLMFCLLMSKYTLIGIGNYLRWNLSMLRQPMAA
jgi:hypothetical protein